MNASTRWLKAHTAVCNEDFVCPLQARPDHRGVVDSFWTSNVTTGFERPFFQLWMVERERRSVTLCVITLRTFASENLELGVELISSAQSERAVTLRGRFDDLFTPFSMIDFYSNGL